MHKEYENVKGDYIIPENVRYLPWGAFRENNELTSVVVHGNISSIDSSEFVNCENLQSVTLKEGIKTVDMSSFSGCKKLTSLILPDSVYRCSQCESKRYYFSEPVFNASRTVLFLCPNSVSGDKWTVPDGIRVINAGAFKKSDIREITLPVSVTRILSNAFAKCSKLEKVTVMNPNTQICYGAFLDCDSLKEIVWDKPLLPEDYYILRGKELFETNTKECGNLNHMSDSKFDKLQKLCAKGDAQAMYDFGEFFSMWSKVPGANAFYKRAENYWKYYAYCLGNEKADIWFENWLKDNNGKKLEVVIPVIRSEGYKGGQFTAGGKILNQLGFPFFDPNEEENYIRYLGEGHIVEVCAFDDYDPADEYGYGMEEYYRWWYLDKYMQRIPGTKNYVGSDRDKRRDGQYEELKNTVAEYFRKITGKKLMSL